MYFSNIFRWNKKPPMLSIHSIDLASYDSIDDSPHASFDDSYSLKELIKKERKKEKKRLLEFI